MLQCSPSPLPVERVIATTLVMIAVAACPGTGEGGRDEFICGRMSFGYART